MLSICRCCWFRPTVKINPRHFLSPLCFSPSLPKSFSPSLSLPLSCLIPHYDLPVFISYKNLMICMFWLSLITINCLRTHHCITWEIAYNNITTPFPNKTKYIYQVKPNHGKALQLKKSEISKSAPRDLFRKFVSTQIGTLAGTPIYYEKVIVIKVIIKQTH